MADETKKDFDQNKLELRDASKPSPLEIEHYINTKDLPVDFLIREENKRINHIEESGLTLKIEN